MSEARSITLFVEELTPTLLSAFGASLVQFVEHLICNQGVGGSSPLAGTIFETVAESGESSKNPPDGSKLMRASLKLV